ncbi:hypothetical protein HPB47_015386 [Ixodes persulcatus]|uniref:Uncharacterized protein n=1 Tax=Ixodes persulcatus TaxID=34615 RepID=A0AC60QUH8_IXOPE|nr:hypothetical protein HPB47_015386 [Ixodes persulcatus]
MWDTSAPTSWRDGLIGQRVQHQCPLLQGEAEEYPVTASAPVTQTRGLLFFEKEGMKAAAGNIRDARIRSKLLVLGGRTPTQNKQRHGRPTCGGRPIYAHCVITAVKPATFTVDAPTDNWGCAGSTRTTRAQGTTNALATSRSTSDAHPPQCRLSAVQPAPHRHDVQRPQRPDPAERVCLPCVAGKTKCGNAWSHVVRARLFWPSPPASLAREQTPPAPLGCCGCHAGPAEVKALSFMKDQAGHTCDVGFASVEPTVEFMKTMHRWFLLMNVSNSKQHIHLNHPDAKQFSSPCDERLDWLEIAFIEYLLELKKNSLPQNLLTKETYHALVLTTHSNVECIRYLLREREFGFVLTRKFSGDPLEALFGFLRRTAGCNDALNMRATLNGLEKMLKTGLIASSNQSNVASSSSYQTGTLVTVSSHPVKATVSSHPAKASISFPLIAEEKLRELCLSPKPQQPGQPGPGAASIAMVGRFIARAISEKINCDCCIALVLKPKSSAPVDDLIAYQDKGGLCYPTSELITALTALKSFVDTALQHRKNIVKPLQTSVERAVQVMMDLPILMCRSGDRQHRQLFLELLCMKFVKPLLTNYAADMTDKNTVGKLYGAKPLSRKLMKLT